MKVALRWRWSRGARSFATDGLRVVRRDARWLAALGSLAVCSSAISCRRDQAPEANATQGIAANSAVSQGEKAPFAIDLNDLPPSEPIETIRESGARFTEVQQSAGVAHKYINGERGRVMISETIGGGIGWLDFDCDGRWDLFANQGGDATNLDPTAQPLDELYRNLDGGHFQGIAEAARVREPFYSQAVAIGDYDNDGFDDIYVSNLTANTLWHNCGDGTFVEVAHVAGVADERWSVSSAWADLDRDGDLDLYVCNYVVYDPLNPESCRDTHGRDALCNPGILRPWPDACYINQGDGTFIEQAQQRGLVGPNNRALGVAVADFTGDDWPDVYVANDTTDNFLFVNEGDGNFKDQAQLLGCAVNREGAAQASMGVGVGDFDRNGWLDLYVTNFYEESNTLYANFGKQGFQDLTAFQGLHQPTLALLGFGTLFEDFDQDGALELFVANGHVNNAPSNPILKMPAQLFTFSRSRWLLVNEAAGDYFLKPRLGRGVATADIDADGDVDLAVLNQNDELALLRNDSRRGNYLELRFQGRQSNRRGIGCRVTLTSGDLRLVRELCGGTSFASSMQPALAFGLGEAGENLELEVRWPSGIVQRLSGIKPNQSIELIEPTK